MVPSLSRFYATKSLTLFQSVSSCGMTQRVTAETMLALRERMSDKNNRDTITSDDDTYELGLGNESNHPVICAICLDDLGE